MKKSCQVKLMISFVAIVAMIGGCGSNHNNNTPPVSQTIQGKVIGSHYEGTWVCIDTNTDGLCDDESITATDANGNWTLPNPYNQELNVVAEIYVDDIKHSNYSEPPVATPVEKPMIFVAPLQGMVNSQLIVSPISTKVYRYMQENGVPFEAAKEAVADELGVSSDTLLTNYNVPNPSADHVTLQQSSNTETEKLGLTMHYHNNDIIFNFKYVGEVKSDGSYTITDYYVPHAQDPDHHITIGKKIDIQSAGSDSTKLTFVLGRKGSKDAADWWNRKVSTDETTYEYKPTKLNFGLLGELTLYIDDKKYVFTDFGLAQGRIYLSNSWWFGGKNCLYNAAATGLICKGKDEDGNTVALKFIEAATTINTHTIEVYKWDLPAGSREESEIDGKE